jgi:hypothetical protein
VWRWGSVRGVEVIRELHGHDAYDVRGGQRQHVGAGSARGDGDVYAVA